MANILLKPGREKSLLRRHPWIFSGAIHKADDNIASGSTVDLLSSDKHFLARASYSPASQIRARVWMFDPNEIIDADFFRRRIRRAIAQRTSLFNYEFSIFDNWHGLMNAPHSNAIRLEWLVHARSK